jgi:SAM-dependent methyltransferase
MKSRDFFKKNFDKFDVIFIDGDHYYEQVRYDFIECLKILNPGGIIFLHDVLPRSEAEQTIPQKIDIWTGDVWKLILELMENSKALEIYIANIDFGVCMIKPKDNIIFGNLINYKNLSYEDFIERLYKKANILKSENFIQKI